MKIYHGIAASQGIVRSHIIKVSNENDFLNVGKGNILLVKKSFPGWVVPLMKAGGMICEVGGVFSHIAIICREMNKPCVTGIDNIFNELENGAEVLIDGAKGEIYVYDRETDTTK